MVIGTERKLWQALGSPTDEAMALSNLGGIASACSDSALAEQYATQALRLFRQTHHPAGEATALSQLAALACERGDDRQTASMFHQALLLCSGIDERWSIARALAGLSELASRHGQAETAATIIGALDALGRAVGAKSLPPATASLDRAIAMTRAAIGEERFTQLHAGGQRLRLDEAVAV